MFPLNVSQPVFSNGQFLSSVWKIYPITSTQDDLSSYTINAENNYWGTTDVNVIQQWIWDGTDSGNETSPIIDYDPYLLSP